MGASLGPTTYKVIVYTDKGEDSFQGELNVYTKRKRVNGKTVYYLDHELDIIVDPKSIDKLQGKKFEIFVEPLRSKLFIATSKNGSILADCLKLYDNDKYSGSSIILHDRFGNANRSERLSLANLPSYRKDTQDYISIEIPKSYQPEVFNDKKSYSFATDISCSSPSLKNIKKFNLKDYDTLEVFLHLNDE